MRIMIAGGTGLIGSRLTEQLVPTGNEIIILTRKPHDVRIPNGVSALRWDGYTPRGWQDLITGNTVIVNLAGRNPANWRWTDDHKQRVYQSRIDTSKAIVEAIRRAPNKPLALIQASAVGYYGSHGTDPITEETPPTTGFRAEVCIDWEAVVADLPIRTVWLRIGIVFSREGGALPPFVLASRFFGKQLGDGQQMLPWIHNDDMAQVIVHLINTTDASGVYNVAAPNPVTNADLMTALAQVRGSRALFPVPEWALRLGMGEQASVILDSQNIRVDKLLATGYRFRYPTIDRALRDLVK